MVSNSEKNLNQTMTTPQKVRRLAETAMMVALSTILAELAVIKFPFGGSVTIFSQVPLIVISYRYGIKWGSFAGLTMAIIQLLFGLENFSYVSGIAAFIILIFADYIIAFGALGFGGLFRNKIKNQVAAISLGGLCVSLIRYLCHFISGVTIWKEYAGDMPVWEYSLKYNGGYMIPETIVTVIGCAVIAFIFDLTSQEIKTRLKK